MRLAARGELEEPLARHARLVDELVVLERDVEIARGELVVVGGAERSVEERAVEHAHVRVDRLAQEVRYERVELLAIDRALEAASRQALAPHVAVRRPDALEEAQHRLARREPVLRERLRDHLRHAHAHLTILAYDDLDRVGAGWRDDGRRHVVRPSEEKTRARIGEDHEVGPADLLDLLEQRERVVVIGVEHQDDQAHALANARHGRGQRVLDRLEHEALRELGLEVSEHVRGRHREHCDVELSRAHDERRLVRVDDRVAERPRDGAATPEVRCDERHAARAQGLGERHGAPTRCVELARAEGEPVVAEREHQLGEAIGVVLGREADDAALAEQTSRVEHEGLIGRLRLPHERVRVERARVGREVAVLVADGHSEVPVHVGGRDHPREQIALRLRASGRCEHERERERGGTRGAHRQPLLRGLIGRYGFTKPTRLRALRVEIQRRPWPWKWQTRPSPEKRRPPRPPSFVTL